MATINKRSSTSKLKVGVKRTIVKKRPTIVTATAEPERVKGGVPNPEFVKAIGTEVKALNRPGISLGCDPELFVVDQTGKVIGSERFISAATNNENGVAVDGVQVEFHPQAGGCRQGLASSIGLAFQVLRQRLDSYAVANKGVKLKPTFRQLVTVRKEELMGLSETAQALGCLPSLNAYGPRPIEIDGRTYLKRSAAGHIHLGAGALVPKGSKSDYSYGNSRMVIDPETFVKLLDIFVGNTLVLLDRDEGAAERRQNYGRAGEWRQKPYGIEYRTLSNFWLRSYPLMSLTFSLARNTFGIAYSDINTDAHYHQGLGKLALQYADLDKVQQAINTNDYDLALETYKEVVRPIFAKMSTYDGVFNQNIKAFDFFITKSAEQWFPEDPEAHWIEYRRAGGPGWETYCQNTVIPAAREAKADLTLTT